MLYLLDGLLLGDGGIYIDHRLKKNGKEWNGKAWFAQSCNSEEYLKFIWNELNQYGIPFGTALMKRKDKKSEYRLTSRRSLELGEQRIRWYKDGTKIVPEDIQLSPITCLHWYIGDGSLGVWRNYLWNIQLNTLAYTDDEREMLRDKLVEVGISSRAYHKGGRVIVNRSSVPDFLKYIGQSPVKYYNYKWRLDELCHVHPNTQIALEIDNQQPSP